MQRSILALSVLSSALVTSACNSGDGAETQDTATTPGMTGPTSTAGMTTTTGPDVPTTSLSSSTGDDSATSEVVTTSTDTDTTSDAATDTTDTTSDSEDPSDTDNPSACDEPPTFEAGKVPTTILHVAPNGMNGPACGPEASPCATITGAASKATPGTAIRLHPGLHAAEQYITGLTGTVDAPIWIGGIPGEDRPVLEGGAEGLHLTQVRYVIVHDLEVRGATANGINIDDGGEYDDPDATRHLVLRDLHVHDIGQGGNQDCIKLSGINDYWVVGSELHNCGGGGSAIDHVGCHHGLILGNYIHDNGGNAVQSKGGSDDIEIRGNRIVDSGPRALNMGGSTGFEFFRPSLSNSGDNFEARDIRAIANTIVGSDAPVAFVGCIDCLVSHNTFIRPERWLFRILQETISTNEFLFLEASGGEFAGNVVVFERSQLATYVNIGSDTAPETFSFTNNLWYASDNPAQSSPAQDLPAPEVGGIAGQDPLLVNLAGGDFHLQPGSPAIAAGVADARVVRDLDGVCYADPPTLGAFEIP